MNIKTFIASSIIAAFLIWFVQWGIGGNNGHGPHLPLAKAAVESVADAKKAVDEQVKSEIDLREKVGEENEDTAKYASELKAAAKTAKEKAFKAKKAVAAAQEALSQAEERISSPQKGIFHQALFVVLALLFSSAFPLSAIAYGRWTVPSLDHQLEIDYKMLGDQTKLVPRKRNYAFHYTFTIFLASVGAALFCWQPPASLLDINTQHGMQLGFLGAYIYSIGLIYRRYTTRDLQPHVYLSCSIGLVAGMVFNFVAFEAITGIANITSQPEVDEFKGVGAGAAAILAFSLGFFPNLAIRWFGRISRTSLNEGQRRSDALPLSLIDGISELHESRLKDEGIDNVQNLATADIFDLVTKTPYSAQQIIAWVDQALLLLYVDASEIDSFRRAGVRSVTDFHDMWDRCILTIEQRNSPPDPQTSGETVDAKEMRKAIALQLATTEQRLDGLHRATKEGPNMQVVRTYWNNVQTASVQIRDLLINQVCGGVGRALRENSSEGTRSAEIILSQVAQSLLAVAASSGKLKAVGVSPESLHGRAALHGILGEPRAARRLLIECVEQFPDDPVAYNDLAWLDLTMRSQQCDPRTARNNAQTAIKLVTTEIERTKTEANEAGKKKSSALKASREAKKAEEVEAHKAEAYKADIEQAATEVEVKRLTSNLAGYLDTLALAEIFLGDLAAGKQQSQKAIKEWANSGHSPDGRFGETLVRAAEIYLSKDETPSADDKAKAFDILTMFDELGDTNEKTKARSAKLRKDHGL